MATPSDTPDELVIPSGPFWDTLDPVISSAVALCFTPQELEDLKLDPSASNPAKLHTLQEALTEKLLTLEAASQPSTLHEQNYNQWQDLKSSLFHVHRGLGDKEEQEKILLEMINTPSAAGRDLAALHNLSALCEEKGEYEKAERLALEVLPAIQGHALLGAASPQALGSLRVLIKAMWGQGKTAQADDYVKQASASIDNLVGTPFAKYQQEERDALVEVMAGMKSK
ncbi:hypothetical protein P170DRAFT_431780 [Aspergillus steynii IBT 23096]|uniref:Tetratricopeptide repeat domain protein n=1 Tax=Aspergillus steynii IBT 23096 TaxID=1392250 RepID=A0A2I2GMN7_9EURO|nr:uncharacterized protein P170DRAFT_431780 [Aspergillus steynii IBT 23096]PLB54120.1 hypothetical protein P170DRAFT_431780 [Aspergillus steynii IBT 23096]